MGQNGVILGVMAHIEMARWKFNLLSASFWIAWLLIGLTSVVGFVLMFFVTLLLIAALQGAKGDEQ